MNFKITHRDTDAIIYTAEIDADNSDQRIVKLGLAVRAAVKDGVDLSYANLSGINLSSMNLSGVNLSSANLSYANLSEANLTRANLSYANLSRVNLSGANLYGVNLSDANLDSANLYDANLTGVNLYDANLTHADLTCANLTRANLDVANLLDTNLSRTVLWSTVGNNLHIKTIQAGDYIVTYTDTVMQIGCQCHNIADWWKFSDAQINVMDLGESLPFWKKWKPILLQIIAASPAKSTGYVAPVKAEEATTADATA